MIARCVIGYLIVCHFMCMSFLCPASGQQPDSEIRMNQVQVIGTHNSYHIQPHPSVMKLIRKVTNEQADAIEYTHRPLTEQLSELGMRQFELDIYYDPKGGMYANPKAIQIVKEAGLPELPNHDPKGELKKPGLKIIHGQDIDFLTTALTFKSALQEIKAWSRKNPTHVPITILVELKQNQLLPGLVKPLPFDRAALESIDAEILSVFDKDDIISPDFVRGDHATLRAAIHKDGWPLLSKVRGKVMFAIDNGGPVRDNYLANNSLDGKMMFVSVDTDHPAAAFAKVNNPVGNFERIKKLVKDGFIVRTRADANTSEARTNDPKRRDKAFASGAQLISTDYPEPNPKFSEYCVKFAGGKTVRSNPVNAGEIEVESISPSQTKASQKK